MISNLSRPCSNFGVTIFLQVNDKVLEAVVLESLFVGNEGKADVGHRVFFEFVQDGFEFGLLFWQDGQTLDCKVEHDNPPEMVAADRLLRDPLHELSAAFGLAGDQVEDNINRGISDLRNRAEHFGGEQFEDGGGDRARAAAGQHLLETP